MRNALLVAALFLSCSANTQKPVRTSGALNGSNEPGGTLRKGNSDCKAITDLQIIIDDGEKLSWEFDDLNHPRYLNRMRFIDTTINHEYNGKVCDFNKNGEIAVQGFLNNGKVDGRWISYSSDDDERYIDLDIEFYHINGEVRYRYYKALFDNKLPNRHIEHIKDDLYVDSLFTYEPYSDSLPQYYLSWVSWGKEPGSMGFAQTDKRKTFDRKGNLTSFYLDDSIYIRWYENELERIFPNSCELDNGLCIGIVKGKIEKFYKLTKGEGRLEIPGGFQFEQIKDSFYLEYEIYGKKNSVSVILN